MSRFGTLWHAVLLAAKMALLKERGQGFTVICILLCSEGGLPRNAIVGVLGGGQLGRMMALAAVRSSAVNSVHAPNASLLACN